MTAKSKPAGRSPQEKKDLAKEVNSYMDKLLNLSSNVRDARADLHWLMEEAGAAKEHSRYLALRSIYNKLLKEPVGHVPTFTPEDFN